MIDVSDGLIADLGHVARASKVIIDLTVDAFEVPEPLQAVSAATGTDPYRLILTGGEDHALAAVFPHSGRCPGGLDDHRLDPGPGRRRRASGSRRRAAVGRECGLRPLRRPALTLGSLTGELPSSTRPAPTRRSWLTSQAPFA